MYFLIQFSAPELSDNPCPVEEIVEMKNVSAVVLQMNDKSFFTCYGLQLTQRGKEMFKENFDDMKGNWLYSILIGL